MADTGAPYFIPYVEPTDLVRDYPAADEAQADAVAAALDAIPVLAGIGSNVVQTVKTNVFSTSSTSFVGVTGLTLSITPSTSSSKILLLASFIGNTSADGFGAMASFFRGSTQLTIGNASGSRIRAHSGLVTAADSRPVFQIVMHLLDNPSTTSATTYSVRVRRGGSSSTLTIGQSPSDTPNNLTAVATITAIEVAA